MAKESANNGFIVIDRKLLEWEHFTEPVVLQVFLYLLLKANHKAKWCQGFKCERGATFVSIRTMCEELSMSQHTAIKALRTLEESGELVRKQVTQKLSKTKIVNYSKYQDITSRSGAKSATQSATQSATKQQCNNDNNIIVVDNIHAHTHEKIVNDIFASQVTIEQFCYNEGITIEQCRKLADEVLVEWELVGETHKSEKDAKRHLLDHIRKKAQALNIQSTPVEERKAKFVQECKALLEQGYNRAEVAEFASYYSQPTADGRLLFETFKGWNTLTRFQLNQKRKSS